MGAGDGSKMQAEIWAKELEKKADNAMHELHQMNIYLKSIAQSLQKIADRPTPVTAGGQYIIPGTEVYCSADLSQVSDCTGQPGA